jgi:hypothetical protein
MARVDAGGERHVVGRERVAREGPGDHGPRGRRGGQQRQHPAQTQRHGGEPHAEPEQQRQQRAARVGEHDAGEQQPEPGPGERVGGRMPGAARGQPQQRRDAERGHQPDCVPVAEGLPQARVGLVGGERAGEDLGQQGPPAHDEAGQRDAVQHRRPAPRRHPHEREPARERRNVGEGPVGLEPGVAGGDRPHDRDRREDRQRREGQQRQPAVQPPRRAPGQDSPRHQHGAAEDQADLGPRRPLEPQAAVGAERDRSQHDADEQRHPGVGAHARQREGTEPRAPRRAKAAGER